MRYNGICHFSRFVSAHLDGVSDNSVKDYGKKPMSTRQPISDRAMPDRAAYETPARLPEAGFPEAGFPETGFPETGLATEPFALRRITYRASTANRKEKCHAYTPFAGPRPQKN